ncbi:MAG TPA: hypothetical protein VGG39_12405 [Polyangiaceae bacterium]
MLRALQQLQRGAIFPELRHGHTTERERSCVLSRADEAQRSQGIEAREVARGGQEIGIASQLLLPAVGARAVHQDA